MVTFTILTTILAVVQTLVVFLYEVSIIPLAILAVVSAIYLILLAAPVLFRWCRSNLKLVSILLAVIIAVDLLLLPAPTPYDPTHMIAEATSLVNTSHLTITLEVDADRPGLGVRSFASHGVDVRSDIRAITGVTEPSVEISIRLYPTGLRNGNTLGFHGVIEQPPYPADSGPFNKKRQTGSNDVEIYSFGGLGIDDFEIVVDDSSKAEVVTTGAFRITIARVKLVEP